MRTFTAQERKDRPVFSGVLKYFPRALLEVAKVSKKGNDQHNPGQPLHWAKEKSTDEADALIRHQLEAGSFDTDGERHSAKVAWRALAQLERELEAAEFGEVLSDQDELTADEIKMLTGGKYSSLEEIPEHRSDNGELPFPTLPIGDGEPTASGGYEGSFGFASREKTLEEWDDLRQRRVYPSLM